MMSHRACGLRKPAVGDDTGTYANRVDDLAVALAVAAVDRALDADRTRHRVVGRLVLSDARVERAVDLDPLSVKVQSGEQAAVGFTLDRCDGGADLALDLRVIDRLSSGASRSDLNDELDELLHDEHKLVVLIRHFDHDASHGASSVESLKQPLDGTALPQLSSRALAYAAFRISSSLLRMRSTPRLDRAACQRTPDVLALLERYGVLLLHGPPRH